MLKELKRRAAPMHPAMLALGAANAVEALCLSYLGQEHLLTYGAVLPLLLLLDAIGLGWGAGAASLYARVSPERRIGVAYYSVTWAFATGLLTAFALLIVCGYLCRGAAATYIYFWAPAIPFALLNFSALALLRAADHSRLAAKAIMLGAVLQAVLTPTLILGVGVLPDMGISGAALAHTLAAISVSASLLLLTRAGPTARLPPLTEMLAIGRALLGLALPAALSNVTVPLGAALIMTLLRASHDGYVAAFALALRIEGFCLVAFYAYSSVVGPLVVVQRQQFPHSSYFTLLKTSRNHCLTLGAVLALVLTLLPFSFDYWLAECPDAIAPLQRYFWTIPLSYGAYGFVMLANGVFNGVGRPYYGLCLSLLRCLVLLWPAATLMNHLWPGHGVYMAITLSNGLSAAAAVFLLKHMYAPGPDSISSTAHQPLARKLL